MDTTSPSTSTERVRRYREKIREEGWTLVAVRVPEEKVEELKAFVKKLGKPKPRREDDSNQLPLFQS